MNHPVRQAGLFLAITATMHCGAASRASDAGPDAVTPRDGIAVDRPEASDADVPDGSTLDGAATDVPAVDAPPPVPGHSTRDLYALAGGTTASGSTEVHALTGGDGFQTYDVHSPTALAPTGSDGTWTLLIGDYDLDGSRDLFAVNHGTTGSGMTEVHVLDGASNYTTFLLHAATGLGPTGSSAAWTFLLGDYNGDGHVDLYGVDHGTTGSGMTEVHVVDGASAFGPFLVHAATAAPPTGADLHVQYALADKDHDGLPDLYSIVRTATGSGTTELHALSGASGFQSYVEHTTTALPLTGSDASWWFSVADLDADGTPDLFALQRAGAPSGRTEAQVLSGASSFATPLLRVPTPIASTGPGSPWQFDLQRPVAVSAHLDTHTYTRAIAKAGGANGGGYAYAPTILHDASGYHLWACDSDGVHLGDTIAYAHSADGNSWSSPVTALYMPSALQHVLEHTCDPSVVRFSPPGDPGHRTFYYLYHSSNSFTGGPGGSYLATVNSVARALVPQGPYAHYMGGNPNDDGNWVVNPGARQPVFIQRPAVACGNGHEADCYGAGEPTVVLRGSTLHMWYTDTTASPSGNYYTTSTDGVNWAAAQSIGVALGSVEVKFDAATGRYVMVGLTGNHSATPHFATTTSADGVHWSHVDESTAMPAFASEVGWSGDERGFLVAGHTLFGFAAPYGLGSADSWGHWELYVTPVFVARE